MGREGENAKEEPGRKAGGGDVVMVLPVAEAAAHADCRVHTRACDRVIECATTAT